jgi:hypothetical protein
LRGAGNEKDTFDEQKACQIINQLILLGKKIRHLKSVKYSDGKYG